MKILIVDDLKENLYLLETLLKGSGYEVVTAKDGVEALDKLKEKPINMIISDILMPKMDGFQLCRECKKDDSIKRIPFIFYTATYIDIKDEELALSLGAEKFILKPQEPETFLKILKEVIKEHKKGALIAPKESIKEEEEIYFEKYNKRLIQKLEKKMLDLEKSEKLTKHLFSVLKTVRNINQLIIREKNINVLLQETCDILIEVRGYNSAWLGFLKDEKTFTIVVGSPLKEIVSRFREQVLGGDYPPCIRKALIQKDLFLLINTYKECGDCCLKDIHGEEQSAIIRIEHNHKLLGLLAIMLAPEVYINKEEKELLEELSGDLAFGLQNIELEENLSKRTYDLKRQ
jgi:CheY-like chemotaxis protein